MTLLEIERLVRKIAELLRHEGNSGIARKLAEDFAAACHAVNLRLQQCETMIKAEDRQQAIQLAETPPNILDMVTFLEFGGVDQWREYCRQNSLPVSDRIDVRAVQALNECYALGIATDHPLYGAYREAVLSRNNEKALVALQSITRLNPTDANAASELARLDAKVLDARLRRLGGTLKNGNSESVVAEIESIEAFGFNTRPDDEVWRQAQVIRCQSMVDEAGRSKNSGDWVDALSKLDFVRRLERDFKLDLPADCVQKLEVLEAWAREQQDKDKKERAFLVGLSELRRRILQSEEKDTSARYVELEEMRDDYEGLHKVWRSLVDFTRPIPEDVTSSFRKRSALLEAEIARRVSIRRRVIVSSSAAVLALVALVAWIVLGKLKAHDIARRLHEAVAQQQTHLAESLLDRLHNEDKRFADAGNVAAAAAGAETFVTRETALLTNFNSTLATLPAQLPREPDARRVAAIADQLALTRSALDALAPDLKAENQPRLQAFEKQWQTYLETSSVAVNTLYEQQIAAAEKVSTDFDYRAPMKKLVAQLESLSDTMRKIHEYESGYTNHLAFRSDLLERAQTVDAKLDAYLREYKKLQDGAADLARARNLSEFSDGINLAASSEFSSSPVATAARSVQSLGVNPETMLRTLLQITNAATWAYVKKDQPARFIPEVVMPAERLMFKRLNSDPAISANHQRPRLWLSADGAHTEDWITVGGFETTVGWNEIEAFVASPDVTTAVFEKHAYGFFDGHYRLTPTEPVYRIEWLGDLNDTASFYSAGVSQVLGSGDSYAKPLLEALDVVKNSIQGSAVFRAYLFLCLADIMKLQPDAWGLSFCPAVTQDELQIRKIVGGKLANGDWFVAAKTNAFNAPLAAFFLSRKPVSYMKQATGLFTLAHAVSGKGLQYAGFVSIEEKPVVDPTLAAEPWGYSTPSGRPVLVKGILPGQVMPLSPLFALDNPVGEYLSEAEVNPNDDSFRGVLPPLFAQP